MIDKNIKYPFSYGKDTDTYTKGQAISYLENFCDVCYKNKSTEKSFHLYYFENKWHIIADSVKKRHGRGEHITEIKVQLKHKR